jgi:hypothetical protein
MRNIVTILSVNFGLKTYLTTSEVNDRYSHSAKSSSLLITHVPPICFYNHIQQMAGK